MDYTAIKNEIALPAYNGLTDAAIATLLMAKTVVVPAGHAILAPSQILNAVVFADLAALTQLQVSQLTLLLAGSSVDASVGTSIRAGIQALFAGKTTTLANLGALVAPFDATTAPFARLPGEVIDAMVVERARLA
jgi:hypothetical protein